MSPFFLNGVQMLSYLSGKDILHLYVLMPSLIG